MDNLDNLDDLFEDNLVSEESNSSEPALVIQDIDSDELFTEEMFSGSGSEQSTVISKLLQDRGITDNKITIILPRPLLYSQKQPSIKYAPVLALPHQCRQEPNPLSAEQLYEPYLLLISQNQSDK